LAELGFTLVVFFLTRLPLWLCCKVHRMAWSMVLLALCEVATMEAMAIAAKAERKRDSDGDALGGLKTDSGTKIVPTNQLKEEAFTKLWKSHSGWSNRALDDAVSFARISEPRPSDAATSQQEVIRTEFYTNLWPALEARGWKEDEDDDEVFTFQSEKFVSVAGVMNDVLRIHPELTNMVLPLLVKIEEGRTKSLQFENQKRAKEVALSASNINLQALQEFLDRYAPNQLLHDRIRKANKISLGRRLLTACYFAEATNALMKAADDLTSEETIDEKLLNLLAVDGRSALPHPLWTNKHDVVLLRAIYQHGWIGGDESLKEIIKDRELKWGFPFEATKNAPVQRMGLDERNNLRNTAERAASVLGNNADVFDAIPVFNRNLVVESYGLTNHEIDENQNEGNLRSRTWRVDQSLLHQASKKSEPSQVAVDLPAKKDLVKRAKAVISKAMARLDSGSAFVENAKNMENDPDEGESNGYVAINQGNRCYVLLAELVRAVLKGSNKSAMQMRIMWKLARDEAMALIDMVSSQADSQNEMEELKKILSQIKLAKKSTYSSMTQGKNVLRVMVGEKPVPPRNHLETMFPAPPAVENRDDKANPPPKRDTKKNDPALGERALGRAMKKAQDKHDGMPLAFSTNDDESLGIQLTMVEVYILSALCMESMPLVLPGTKDSGLSRAPTWEGVLEILHIMAKDQLKNSIETLKTCKSALERARNEGFGPEAVATLASKVAKAESMQSMRDEAASTVADYMLNHPATSLAKKR
jgi:hypothetical protein